MGDFKGVSEKFSVNLVSGEGHGSERIRCEVGLDGLVISSPDGSRTLRKYPLNHISRWGLRGASLVLYTKTPVDVEEHTMTLQGDQHSIQCILDTLTCSCMQMVELLQSKESSKANTEVTNSLTNLLSGAGKSKPQLATLEEVEYWRDPEKSGWMQSQGEVIKSWRRRWFVLKQGFLFRFSNPTVTSSTKPRGVVDLSKVTDVTEAREQTGRPNSLRLSTETGHVAYVCDNETELVEWFSALEGAVSAIVRKVAGLEDAPPPAQNSTAKAQSDWARQLEKGFSSAGSASVQPSRSSSSAREVNPMVKIVGYDVPGTVSQPTRQSSHRQPESSYQNFGPSRSDYGGKLNYSNISGIAGIANEAGPRSSSTFSDSLANSQQYPAYPVLTPSRGGEHSQDPAGYGGGASYRGQGEHSYGQPDYQRPPQAVQQQHQQPSSYYEHRQSLPGESQYSSNPAPNGYAAQLHAQGQGDNIWQVHYTENGRAYYYNTQTGSTQWQPPPNMA